MYLIVVGKKELTYINNYKSVKGDARFSFMSIKTTIRLCTRSEDRQLMMCR